MKSKIDKMKGKIGANYEQKTKAKLLAVLIRVLLAQRSEAITSLAVSGGLNLALGWFSSF